MAEMHDKVGKLLADLNPAQKEAASFGDGPLIIVAGAGTGKTKTLASRVAYLISSGVDPQRILLLTFTRRAAEEMLKRADSLISRIGRSTGKVWSGTFHAIANKILRIYAGQAGLPEEFTIMDQTDSEDLMDFVRNELDLDKTNSRFPKKGTCLAIYSRKMNSNDSLENVIKDHFPWCIEWKDRLSSLYQAYIDSKLDQNVLDYDDLLIFWDHLLDDPDNSQYLESQFDHILVDEYQDTNFIQSDILRKLRRINKNITVVGDDAQAIYSFRSATIRNMLDFPKHFPGASIITLEENYRSIQAILNTSNILISQAPEHYSKSLFSRRKTGGKPELVICMDESFQDNAVIERVLKRREEGISLNRQAVLFRAASHSASLEIALARHKIPFIKYGGLRFLETSHIKDLIAVLRITENPKDERGWFRVLQLIKGVGPQTAADVIEHVKLAGYNPLSFPSFKASPDVRAGLVRLYDYFSSVYGKNLNPLFIIEHALIFYEPLLQENYDNPDQRLSDIQQLAGLSSGYQTLSFFLADLILDPPMFTSDIAGKPVLDEDYLVLSTIHSAKGLEWNCVYIIHAADGWIPSDLSAGSGQELDEELRLLYVAMTRAKDYLSVLYPKKHYLKPKTRSDNHIYGQLSRFLNEEVIETMIEIYEGKTERSEIKAAKINTALNIRDKLKESFR